jgi:hypothetical protein
MWAVSSEAYHRRAAGGCHGPWFMVSFFVLCVKIINNRNGLLDLAGRKFK